MLRLSVIVPVYNTPDVCLENMVRSVSRLDADTEIICVVDSPGEPCEKILRRLACAHGNIRLLVNDMNRGVSYSRNRGLDEARGEYVAFVDADDEIDSVVYRHGLARIEANGLDALALGGINEIHGMQKGTFVTSTINDAEQGGMLAFLECVGMSSCSVLYRRSFIEEHKLRFSLELTNNEDFLFVTAFVQSGARLGLFYANGYIQRGHPASTTRCKPTSGRFISCVKAAAMMLDILGQGKMHDDVRAWYAKRILWEMTQTLDIFTVLSTYEKKQYSQFLGRAARAYGKPFTAILSFRGRVLLWVLARFPYSYMSSQWLIARPLWHFGMDKVFKARYRVPSLGKGTPR